MNRFDGRATDALRPVTVKKDIMPNSGGSCLISCGNTQVLIAANAAEGVPPFLEGKGRGWLTAEYAMLPGSTVGRKKRERNRADSRSIEIQRLIGRSLRSVMDFTKCPDLTFTIDADVLQADGGTRTASITGGYIALALLLDKLVDEGRLEESPLMGHIAAISAGVVEDTPILDLCYTEDSSAQADMNYVGTEDGGIVEVQITGEQRPVQPTEFAALTALCTKGVAGLIRLQKEVLGYA